MDDPTQIAKAGAKDFTTKYADLTGKVKARYDSLGVTYRGTDNRTAFYTPASTASKENQQYFYHSDHLGSSSLITDVDGNVAQHIEYIPFGEVFIDERNNTWNTPYKFNGKELDEETGLYYYGARYYDPRTSVWISSDPLKEKYPNVSSYVYCKNNPVLYVDPNGKEPREGNIVLKLNFNQSFISLLNDPKPKLATYGPHLNRSANDEQASTTLIGGNIKSMGSEFVDLVLSIWGSVTGNPLKETNQAHSWVAASKSSTGYQYVEFKTQGDKKLNIRRNVVNLDEKLGVKGYENVVTEKQTYEGNTLQLDEYWVYKSTKTKEGNQKVEYQHISVDLTKSTGESITKTNWQEAKPSKYNLNEKNK